MKSKVNHFLKTIFLVIIVALVAVGCNSSSSAKPSKQELTDHYVQLAQDEGGLSGLVPKKTLEKVYGCLFDEAYDELSDETLNAMLKVEEFDESSEYPFDVNEEEKKIFDRASDVCAEKYKDDPDLNISSNGPEESSL